jgi:arylsulfatase A-like enzyme
VSTLPDRPNVVHVTCHDLGRHLGPYGRDVATPAVDEMAEHALVFENAFCTQPNCSPSRASVQTGLHPHEHGVQGLVHRGWALRDDVVPLPARLRDAGYATHLFGFQHSVGWSRPGRLGYDGVHRADDGRGHPPARALDVADRFADRLDDLAGTGPFYASLGFVEPHRPFRRDYVPDEAYDRYDPGEIAPLPHLDFDDESEGEAHRRDLADFWALVTATVDRAVGRVREALRERGVADETVLVFTTDHGEPFDRAKTTCYDSGLGVALLVEVPGGPSNERCDELVQNHDLFPTVLEFAGADVPDRPDARSLRPLLGGSGTYDPRDRLYAEHTWHVDPSPCRAVRSDRYKYVKNFAPRYHGSDAGEEELYDLRVDPHERENLLDGPGEPDVAADLRSDLLDWMRATDDPLASGSIPAPSRDRDWLDAH